MKLLLTSAGIKNASIPHAARWAKGIGGPACAIDDQTAIAVVEGVVKIISEGHWKLFAPENDC